MREYKITGKGSQQGQQKTRQHQYTHPHWQNAILDKHQGNCQIKAKVRFAIGYLTKFALCMSAACDLPIQDVSDDSA